jgi:polysaccharide export outer membrane protein
LAAALGFIVLSNQARVKAAEPVQAAGPRAEARALAVSAGTPPSEPSPIEYSLSSGDVVDIYVYDVPELSHTYIVSPSGTISVPLLPEPVQAGGLTPERLARAMEDAFRQSGRLRRPEIAVAVKQSLSNSVAMEGAVKNPQMISEMGRTKLVDVFTQCGGLADDAGNTVTITRGPFAITDLSRQGGVATPTVTLDLKKVMDVSDPASTTAVWPGDRVSVDRQKPDIYYVLGEVKTPGGYPLKNGTEELTVLRALALAGGVSSTARKGKAFIIRKDPAAPKGRDEIKLNLQSILMGRSPDTAVVAEDILVVPGSAGWKALRTIENAPGMIAAGAAAAVIYH